MAVYAPDLYPLKRNLRITKHDNYISQHTGICTALIALDLGVTEQFVITRQRKLGLRKLSSAADYRREKWDLVQPFNITVNDYEPAHCYYCGYIFEENEQRAVANTPSGPKYFCRAYEDYPSCFLRWKEKHR